MKNISYNVLFQRIKENDEEAYEYLFHAFYEKLCTYAYSIIRDKTISEEVVQEVFVKLWEEKETIQIQLSVNAYLYRAVHNSCQNYIAHNKIKQNYIAETQHNYEQSLIFAPLSNSYPIANLLSQEIENEINAAINALPGQCREVFLLCRFENLTYAEAAEKLGISINTVKTQLQRAVVKLRFDLRKYMPTLILLFPHLFSLLN
jgi:RNA polymerase sigma-70 factor (ECF subfamily)